MSVSLIWERANGELIKGLRDCSVPSPSTKEMVDSDLNHGVIRPGGVSVPQVVSVRTFSWTNNGDPSFPITGAALWFEAYYSNGPNYGADEDKTFCDGSSLATFGNYQDAGGSHSPQSDYSTLLAWGDRTDGNYGLQLSLDHGRNYTRLKTGIGNNSNNAVTLTASAMDIGTVDGQLEPGDRAVLYFRLAIPSDFTTPGIYLFCIGMRYDYTE